MYVNVSYNTCSKCKAAKTEKKKVAGTDEKAGAGKQKKAAINKWIKTKKEDLL